MRSRSLSLGLAAAVAATGLAGLAAAPSASASNIHRYKHNAAHYSSLKQCKDTRAGVIRTLTSKGAKVNSAGTCHVKAVTTWKGYKPVVKKVYTYDQVKYSATGPKIAGDYRDLVFWR